jgi:hypothetical protein
VDFFRATVGFWGFKEKLNWQKQYSFELSFHALNVAKIVKEKNENEN